ncbi:glycyl-radical enzyme activating protein [Tepidibacter hydrothermalis]|uniref:Glycyl-radical enzyme activating protein n=1 Tax=Tepidibacter hydrothermalis TaxID=3036126 RepID=A0ABY8EIL3_9FIRM|nr:glycyl-radical enzyme activating protein [Tepidibacter hydrothermalis]WFD10678.1 glycyl-radical enzyme activating protein [Tepidibacter hydrothermalis]
MLEKINRKGSILRIERASIHDGDGIRTVVYFNGCPLKCKWCSTPESQNINDKLGYIQKKCTICKRCISHCPENALSLSNDEKIHIDRSKCTSCFKCIDICPFGAFKKYGMTMSVDEVINEISKDELFYFHSNGGVTISGGECLIQVEFLRDVLKGCKMKGINTAIETSLFAKYKDIEKVLPFVDTLFIDIKHMDSSCHKALTGVKNDIILDNIIKLDSSKYNFDIRIRVPIIPGLNDSDYNLLDTLEFCNKLSKIRYIELLPYHRYGIDTYNSLDIEYELKNINSPSKDCIKRIVSLLEQKKYSLEIRANTGIPDGSIDLTK